MPLYPPCHLIVLSIFLLWPIVSPNSSQLFITEYVHLNKRFCCHGKLTLFQSPPTWFQYVSDFQLEKRYTRPQTQANIFICLLDHVYQAPFANMKIERRGWTEIPLILGRSGTQYVAMGIKFLTPNCRAHLVESYCEEWNISDTNWLRYLFSSYLIKTWLSIWRHTRLICIF